MSHFPLKRISMISFPSGDQRAKNRRCFALNGKWVILALGCTLIQCSCSRNHQLKGEIFIVTSGHESVKLGLVEVLAFQPDSVGRAVQSVKKKLADEDARLKPVYTQIESLERRAEALEKKALEAISNRDRDVKVAVDGWQRAF